MGFHELPMIKLWRVGGLLCLFGCAHAPATRAPSESIRASAHYTVTIFDRLDGAEVRVCLDGMAARELVPVAEGEGHELSGAWLGGRPLETARGRIRLQQGSLPSCVDYTTRFTPPMFRPSDSDAIIVSQAQWLWRPEPFPSGLDASVRFRLPDGGRASLPWPSSDAVYFPDRSAFFSSAFGAFGQFDRQSFSVTGVQVDVTRLGPRPSDDDVRRWISRAMQATASVGDRFPRDRAHFFVVPVQSQEKPVVFGMVRRGGGSSVLLVAASDANLEELEGSWVAVHELSHLWMPPLHAEDRWLSEGIATYLQEVLRARCGMQSGERAWTRLAEGFARGRRSGTGRVLANESQNMNRTGAYHRVYWAGTAFALEVDVRLRESSGGEMTLLRAIADSQRVWGNEARPVPASTVLGTLQDLSGAEFIEALAEQYARRSDFPDVAYLDAPKYREVRAQIMAPAGHACGLSGESSR
jgi:hypothetical protein